MNKKLLATAVAAALAAPGVAFAQASSVTISGMFKVGIESLSYSNSQPLRQNSSQVRLQDNSSRIIFSMVEDLGNGLSAIAQLDQRFAPNNANTIQTSNPLGNGNTWVGLRSTTMGTLTMGRHDLHYGKAPSDLTNKAGALEAATTSLFDYIGAQAIANTTRTPNVLRYDMPNFSGFTGTIAYSSSPYNAAGDMTNNTGCGVPSSLNIQNPCTAVLISPQVIPGTISSGAIGNNGTNAALALTTGVAAGTTITTTGGVSLAPISSRRGEAWNINPKYSNGPLAMEYSYWRAKPDSPSAFSLDQRGDVAAGSYTFSSGFKVGLGWNKSRLTDVATQVVVAERTAWALPVSYVTGRHNFLAHYVRANSLKSAGADVADTGARLFAAAYVYDLSKRTSVGLTYAKINNDSNASYNFFTSAALGTTDSTPSATGGTSASRSTRSATPGSAESPRLLQLTIMHSF